MGDLFLHLGFARRLRFAEGIHPLAVEALVRRPEAVALGASLSLLPGLEHTGTSFFRRLFMSGKQKRAFWLKSVAPADKPRIGLVSSILNREDQKAPGAMARFALGFGVLAHEVLHDRIAETTAGLEGSELDAVHRAQARLWLRSVLPDSALLAAELRPLLQLEEVDSHKKLIDHLGRALAAAFGEPPGSDMLHRWVKGLCADVEPVALRGLLPPSLSLSDEQARGPRYDDARFEDRVAEATTWLVSLANRLAPLFLDREPEKEELEQALVEDGALARPADLADMKAFRTDVERVRDEHHLRGRNPKAAFDEAGSMPAAPASMPPLPEDSSDPTVAEALTQEVSLADIESATEESGRAGFASLAHTHEVSAQHTEEALGAAPRESSLAAPASTQQVSLEQIEEELASQAAGREPAAETAPPFAAPPPAGDPSAPFRAGAVPLPASPAMSDAPPAASAGAGLGESGSEASAPKTPAPEPEMAELAADPVTPGQSADGGQKPTSPDNGQADGTPRHGLALDGEAAEPASANVEEAPRQGGADPAGA
jgi:hypothetical protein